MRLKAALLAAFNVVRIMIVFGYTLFDVYPLIRNPRHSGYAYSLCIDTLYSHSVLGIERPYKGVLNKDHVQTFVIDKVKGDTAATANTS